PLPGGRPRASRRPDQRRPSGEQVAGPRAPAVTSPGPTARPPLTSRRMPDHTPRPAAPRDAATAGEEIVFLLKGYPRLSETFVAQEIRGLEKRGLRIRIVALRRPTDRKTHPIVSEIRAPVAYLPEYLYQEPRRVFSRWRRRPRLPGLPAAAKAWP